MEHIELVIERSRKTLEAAGLTPKSYIVINKKHIETIVADPRITIETTTGSKNGVSVKLTGLFFEGKVLASEMTQSSSQGAKNLEIPVEQYDRLKSMIQS
jgi:hypothetical protein